MDNGLENGLGRERRVAAGRRVTRLPLVRLFLIHGGVGVAVGLAITAALVLADFHDLGQLVRQDGAGFVAVILLGWGLSLTCGSAAIGTAVMLLPGEDEEAAGGRRVEFEAGLRQAVRIRADRGRPSQRPQD